MSDQTSSGLFARTSSQSPERLREDAAELVSQQNWARAAELYARSAKLDQRRGTPTVQELAWTFDRAAELWATADNMNEANQNWQHAATVHREAADKAQAWQYKPETVAHHLITGAEYLLKAQDHEAAVAQLQEALPFAQHEWDESRTPGDLHIPYTLTWTERLLATYYLPRDKARAYQFIERVWNRRDHPYMIDNADNGKAHQCIGLEQTHAASNYMSNRCDFAVNVKWISPPHCTQGCSNSMKAHTARSTISPIKGSYIVAACEYPGLPLNPQGQRWTGGGYICQ